jgi:predicted metalloprotease
MRKRSAVTTAALSLFGLFILGCAIPEPAPFDPADSTDPNVTNSTTQPVDPTQTDDEGSMEGAYSYTTMGEYAQNVVEWYMNTWVDETWPSMSHPFVMYVESGETGPQQCTDYDGNPGFYSGFSYEYCPADMTVYLGQDTLWEFYSETGDAGPAMGIAHEYGHHIQYELGVPAPFTAAQSVDFENQADCISGAWARWMEERGDLETEDDLRDIELMFPIIASAEGEDRDHGTLEEREQAFSDGYLRGESACGLG